MKVLITEPLAEEGIARLQAEPGIQVDVLLQQTPEQLLACIADYDGLIVRSSTKVSQQLFEAGKLRIVGRAGTGVDNIDLQAATDHGVVVVNTPGGNSISVAELTLGSLIACARHLTRADNLLKKGEWAKKQLRGRELNGKTMGLIGLGRIGQEVARRAQSFGLKILAYDPFIAKSDPDKKGIELSELQPLLERSHVISLHVPLTDDTHHIIDEKALASMRDGVILLNYARGGLIDDDALIKALDQGKVLAAGLDAFESEPSPLKELVRHERVVATPHIGASTKEAQEQVGYYVAGYVADYLVRGVLQNAVNYPSITVEEMQALEPYLHVAECLGAFASQIAVGRMKEVIITYLGGLTNMRYKLLSDRALCGALRPILAAQDVNPINARSLAGARGLQVTEAIREDALGFGNLIQLRLITDEGQVEVQGVPVGAGRPARLVSLDGLEIDAPLDGPTLFFKNDDVPGVIGRVGSFAGQKSINIKNLALRSDGAGGAAGVVQVDRRVKREERAQLKDLPGIRFVRMIELPNRD